MNNKFSRPNSQEKNIAITVYLILAFGLLIAAVCAAFYPRVVWMLQQMVIS